MTFVEKVKKEKKMKIYVDKMRVEIDLRESNESITRQILNAYPKIIENDLMVQKIKCCSKTKDKIIKERIALGIDEIDTFCTAEYVIDDSLEPYVVILGGGLNNRLNPGQF